MNGMNGSMDMLRAYNKNMGEMRAKITELEAEIAVLKAQLRDARNGN